MEILVSGENVQNPTSKQTISIRMEAIIDFFKFRVSGGGGRGGVNTAVLLFGDFNFQVRFF